VGEVIRFGTDGWRGRIAEEFTFANVRRVAQAIASYCKERSASSPLVVGYDTRFLSREFAQTAAEVLAHAGLPVLFSETFAPTPAFSYAVVAQRAGGAVVITASHNPPAFNGLKLKSGRGGSVPPDVTAAIEARLPSSRAPSPGPGTPGAPILPFDPRPAYLKRLQELVDLGRVRAAGIAVVVDPMYGAAQGWLSGLLRTAGIPVEELHARVDPLFAATPPEPLPSHLQELSARVREGSGRMRVGFALDGDGDRVAAVDEGGNFVTPHQIFALLLKHLVEHRRMGGAVVGNFATTAMVEKLAKRYALPFHETPIGFKHIALLMEGEDVLIGGEESGGIGVKGHLPERDGTLSALLLLELMAVEGKPLGRLLAELEAQVGPHRYGRIDLPASGPTVSAEAIRRWIERRGLPPLPFPLGEVRELDGLKLLFRDGRWLLLRPSGTEPVIRIYAEAPSGEEVATLLTWGRTILGRIAEKEGDDDTQAWAAGGSFHRGAALGPVDDPRGRGRVQDQTDRGPAGPSAQSPGAPVSQ